MFCRYCGKKNIDGAKFCVGCGRPIVISTQKAKTPSQKAVSKPRSNHLLITLLIVLLVLIVVGVVMAIILNLHKTEDDLPPTRDTGMINDDADLDKQNDGEDDRIEESQDTQDTSLENDQIAVKTTDEEMDSEDGKNLTNEEDNENFHALVSQQYESAMSVVSELDDVNGDSRKKHYYDLIYNESNGHYYAMFHYTCTDFENYEKMSGSYSACEDFCEAMGGHLAVIDSDQENDFIYDYIRNASTENDYTRIYSAYFGYHKNKDERNFKWVDENSTSTYENWNQDPGDGNTAMFSQDVEDGSWVANNFGSKTHYAICEWEPTK